MATITTSWVTYASKTFKPGTGLSVTFQLQARQTAQSVANNTSTIQTRLRSVINSGQGSGYNYKFTCSYASSVSGSGLWTLDTETITTSSNKVISHNNDGTKTISISATAVINGLSMNLSMSANVNLQKINRLATITTAYAFNQKGVFPPEVLFKNPANFNLYLGVDIIDKNNHGVYTIQTPVAAKYNSPYVFDMTDEWDSLLQSATTQKQYKARYFIQTMNGSSQIGMDTEDTDFYIIQAEPTFTAVYEDINSTTTAITGDNQKIIRNQSNLQINISNATAKYYATLTSIKAVINGITYNGTLSGTTGTIGVGTIDVSENINAAVTLTDSRGYTTTNNIEIEVLNWELPTANISLARQNNYYSETDIKVDANYSSLDGENVITIKERHKKTSEQNYSAYTTLTDNVTSTMTLDNQYEWDVQVLVQDLFGSTTYNLTLDKGMPIIYFDRLKRSVSINSFPQNNESLEVLGGDILEIIGDKTDTWSSSGSYAKDSFVTYERYIYKNKTGSNSGTPDTDTTNWKKVSILELMKDIEAGGGGGTTNYNDLGNKPSINGVTLSGNKTTSDLGIVIPTTTSQLTNNSGFITNSVNNLTNYTLSSALSSVATSGSYNDLSNKPTIPTQTSQLTNNSGFITNSVNDLTNYTKTSDLGAVALSNDYDDLDNKPTIPTIPTNVSSFTNDAGYLTSITSSDVTTALGYTPQEEIKTFDITMPGKSVLVDIHTCIKNNEEFKVYKTSQNGTYYYEIINTNENVYTNSFDYVDENNNIIHNEIYYSGSGDPSYTKTTIGIQEEITSSNKLDYSLLDNTPTIPTVGNAKTYYGICDTGSFTGTKQVTISNFVLESGATVIIKFTHGNDYTNTPLLQINNETAKYMKIGSNTLTYKWGANAVLTFVYDGTDFILIEPQKATSSIYGLTTLTDSVSSTSTTSSATPNSVKQAYDLANSKQDEITSSNKLDYSLLDNTPTIPTSTSQLTNDSGYITSSYHDSSKQDTLVSGTNIKTINNTSLLGSGNITIGGGGTATDVQINGTSITSGGEADIITEGTYDSSTNKIATMSDIPTIPTNVSAFTNDAGYITSSALPQDTGWVNISTTRGTWVYLRYRIVGKQLYLEGRASSLSYSGSSTKIGEMPNGTLPSTGENHYFYGHLAGGRIARILVNPSGDIIVDWARNISDGNTYTTATWYSFSTTYFID